MGGAPQRSSPQRKMFFAMLRFCLGGDMKIEKGVEVPSERKRLSYPYAQMDVGDSFFIKDVAL